MENYPDIQRRDGTLFFACPDTDRAAIATSIERLIDMLDSMDGDPDLEPYLADTRGVFTGSADDREGDDADYEPILGAAERHPNMMSWRDDATCHSQTHWAFGDREDAEDDGDDLEPDDDGEPTMAWANEGDQTTLGHGMIFANDENEPELGWCGHGTGWTLDQGYGDTEPNGDELDLNGDETDTSFSEEEGGYGLSHGYDGSGRRAAKRMLRGAPTTAERSHVYSSLGPVTAYRMAR